MISASPAYLTTTHSTSQKVNSPTRVGLDEITGMDGDCFNCAGDGAGQYTLLLASGKILEDTVLCEPCVAGFREVDWVTVQEGSVVVGVTTTRSDRRPGPGRSRPAAVPGGPVAAGAPPVGSQWLV